MKLKLLFVLVLSCSSLVDAFGQLMNVRAALEEDKVIITYDLISETTDDAYVVSIASSQDYSQPLTNVSGDVGQSVTPGFSKKVIWDAKKSVGNFTGELDFMVKADLAYTPLVVLTPSASASVKRKKSLDIEWKGGSPGSDYSVMLFKGGAPLEKLGEVSAEARSFTWNVPKKQEKGKGYDIHIVNNANQSMSANTGPIRVKPRMSGFTKFLIFSAFAAGGYYAYDTYFGELIGPKTLPDPPSPQASARYGVHFLIGF